MDPDENLRQIRDLVKREPNTLDESDVALLVELVDSLDTWITRGGFLPADWAIVQGMRS